jgi:hypothetical protein
LILVHHRENGVGWGKETTGKKLQIEVTENSPFFVADSLDVPPQHIHLHPARCLDTPERFG